MNRNAQQLPKILKALTFKKAPQKTLLWGGGLDLFWKTPNFYAVLFGGIHANILYFNMWHATCDMRYARYDMPHATCDMPATCDVNIVLTILALKHFCFWSYDEDLEERYDGTNEWINFKAVCRTASATPGLLRGWTFQI